MHFVSCVAPAPIEELPAFAQGLSMAVPERPSPPNLLDRKAFGLSCTDELVPYAQLDGTRDSQTWWGRAAESLAGRLIRVMPDAFLYSEGVGEVAGVVTTHVGFGVSTGSAYVVVPTRLVALRAARSRLPFELHPLTSMVLRVRDRSAAGQLQEGDTVTSLGGWDPAGKQPYERSNLAHQRLVLGPGDEMDVEWVRAGVGRMSARVRMIDVDGGFRSLPAAAKIFQDYEARHYVDEKGRSTWSYFNPWHPYGT
jgi:hypothetical protein